MSEAFSGLIGVIVGALLSPSIEAIKEQIAKKRRREYLAIKVSCLLSLFVDKCASVAMDDGLSMGQLTPEGQRTKQVNEPDIINFNELDVDWRVLPPKLLDKIFKLPIEHERRNKKIQSVRLDDLEMRDFSDVFEERQFQYSIIGIMAANISNDLRRMYNLNEINYEEWNPVDFMKTKEKKIRDIREQRGKHNLEMFNSLNRSLNE
jgi:hypothetical protein